MAEQTLSRKIKYEAELSPTFASEIASIPGNEKLWNCIQCGTCSGTCPLSIYMDYTPRRIVAMTRAGFKQEVLQSATIWLCASCYSCTVECPKEIKITDIMYALKRRAIEDGLYTSRFSIPILAREFFEGVLKYGRNNESRLVRRTFLRSHPWWIVKNSTLALRLWSRGRLDVTPDAIKNRRQLRSLLKAVGHGRDRRAKAKGERR